MTSKTKTIRNLYARFSRALSKLQEIARISDWFIALFAPVVIGRSNYVGIGFPTAFENRSPTKIQSMSEATTCWDRN